jgi:phenylacetate-CoA oxygenase PaaH subunit
MAETDGGSEAGGEDRFDVFVQWRRGQPHEYAETVLAPDTEMALMLAKRNIDVRGDPLSVWVAPQAAMAKSAADDPKVRPGTDRSYRQPAGYAASTYGDE